MDKNIKDMRNGILSLQTRRFGNMMEIIIRELYGLEECKGSSCNLYDSNKGYKIAVAFSRALLFAEGNLKVNPLEACICSTIHKRSIKSTDTEKKYNCVFQQLKLKKFDYLYYGILFKDKVLIFKAPSSDIPHMPCFSNFQHKDNKNESQFHLDQTSIGWHVDRYLDRELSYEEIYDLLSKLGE